MATKRHDVSSTRNPNLALMATRRLAARERIERKVTGAGSPWGFFFSLRSLRSLAATQSVSFGLLSSSVVALVFKVDEVDQEHRTQKEGLQLDVPFCRKHHAEIVCVRETLLQ